MEGRYRQVDFEPALEPDRRLANPVTVFIEGAGPSAQPSNRTEERLLAAEDTLSTSAKPSS